jgi:hypothetical protein
MTDNQRRISAHLDNLHIYLSKIREAVTGEAPDVIEAVDMTEVQLLKGMRQIRLRLEIPYNQLEASMRSMKERAKGAANADAS